MNQRMNRNKLNIGAYWLQPYAGSEEHVRDIAACHIDMMVCVHEAMRDTLDHFKTYGVGAVVVGAVPGWWGGNGKSGEMAECNPLCDYEKAAEAFVDHPAIWAIDVGDEPNALDFPHYGKVVDYVEQAFPSQYAFLNLFPNYALSTQNGQEDTSSQLGTKTYEEHIDRYCEHIDLDYISYDFYMYPPRYDSVVGHFYENFRVVADKCLETNKSLWVVLQVNAEKPEVQLSENYLRYQANAALAWGAETIMWACYCAGWWTNNVLDTEGNKTPQYAKLQKVNAELHRLGEDYMRYRRVATHCVGFEGTCWLENSKLTSIDAFANDVFGGVRELDGHPLLIGEMVSRQGDGSKAMMICAADDPFDRGGRINRVVFEVPKGKTVRVYGGNGQIILQRQADGSFAFDLPSCHGALITAED